MDKASQTGRFDSHLSTSSLSTGNPESKGGVVRKGVDPAHQIEVEDDSQLTLNTPKATLKEKIFSLFKAGKKTELPSLNPEELKERIEKNKESADLMSHFSNIGPLHDDSVKTSILNEVLQNKTFAKGEEAFRQLMEQLTPDKHVKYFEEAKASKKEYREFLLEQYAMIACGYGGLTRMSSKVDEKKLQSTIDKNREVFMQMLDATLAKVKEAKIDHPEPWHSYNVLLAKFEGIQKTPEEQAKPSKAAITTFAAFISTKMAYGYLAAYKKDVKDEKTLQNVFYEKYVEFLKSPQQQSKPLQEACKDALALENATPSLQTQFDTMWELIKSDISK